MQLLKKKQNKVHHRYKCTLHQTLLPAPIRLSKLTQHIQTPNHTINHFTYMSLEKNLTIKGYSKKARPLFPNHYNIVSALLKHSALQSDFIENTYSKARKNLDSQYFWLYGCKVTGPS